MISNKLRLILALLCQLSWSHGVLAESEFRLIITADNEHKIAYSSEELYRHIVSPFVTELSDNGITVTSVNSVSNLVLLDLSPVPATSRIALNASIKNRSRECRNASLTLETQQYNHAALPQLATQSRALASDLINSSKTNNCNKLEHNSTSADLNILIDEARSLRNSGQILASYALLLNARTSGNKFDSKTYSLLTDEIEYLHPLYELEYKLATELQSQPDNDVLMSLIDMNERLLRSAASKPSITPERLKAIRIKLDEILLARMISTVAARSAVGAHIQQKLFVNIGQYYMGNNKYPDDKYIMDLLSRDAMKFTLTGYSASETKLEFKLHHVERGYSYKVMANKAMLKLDYDDNIEELEL